MRLENGIFCEREGSGQRPEPFQHQFYHLRTWQEHLALAELGSNPGYALKTRGAQIRLLNALGFSLWRCDNARPQVAGGIISDR